MPVRDAITLGILAGGRASRLGGRDKAWLQRNGVPVEMYIYPRQGHAISEPRLLADAAQRNLDWFARMLL